MPMSVVITFGLRRSKRQKRALSESSIVSETDGCGAIELWCQQWGSFSYQACCHHWCTEHSEYLVGPGAATDLGYLPSPASVPYANDGSMPDLQGIPLGGNVALPTRH